MKFVVQRVSEASVEVEGEILGKIDRGFMVLIGVADSDTEEIADKMIAKMLKLRIFDDAEGKTNLSIDDVGGELLLISQFTLYADCKKGNRPSYVGAAGHETAIPLYEQFCAALSAAIGRRVETGEFGADMKVSLTNDGPVTICMDTKNKE